MIRPVRALSILTAAALGALLTLPWAVPAQAATPTVYTPGTPVVATITNGDSAAPWNLAQGDLGAGSAYSSSLLLPTYTPGGATTGSGATLEPNLPVYPSAGSGTAGVAPYPSGVVGTPGPLDGYCGTGPQPESGSVNRQPAGTTLPFAPDYFPHVVANSDGSQTGYLD